MHAPGATGGAGVLQATSGLSRDRLSPGEAPPPHPASALAGKTRNDGYGLCSQSFRRAGPSRSAAVQGKAHEQWPLSPQCWPWVGSEGSRGGPSPCPRMLALTASWGICSQPPRMLSSGPLRKRVLDGRPCGLDTPKHHGGAPGCPVLRGASGQGRCQPRRQPSGPFRACYHPPLRTGGSAPGSA